jgi:aminopeptidase YwaD
MRVNRLVYVLIPGLLSMSAANADIRELIPQPVLQQIAEETSGEAAKRNLDTVTLQHRMRASDQFAVATAHITRMLDHYQLDDIQILEFDADGETMFGTQKSRPVWQVEFAELWELGERDGDPYRVRRLASWDAMPLSLAQDSLSGETYANLIDIGAGTSDADYEGKDVRDKLVLTSSQPGSVVDRAVGELGAAGIISYAPNQRSAWWRQDDRLVRWGHIGSFPKTESFAFMISLGEARKLQARLEMGEAIRFHAKVVAAHRKGKYSFAEAAIRGAGEMASEEIILTCHLDHPRPGANDNASGCVTILEVARTLQTLINEDILPRPARTIRFLWPAEIEGSIIYLSEHSDTSRIKANLHLDMVGGGTETKAVFRISGGPMSLPTFISDIGFEVGRFVNAETEAFASGGDVAFPLNAPEGGKEPLLALLEDIDMGSDHDVFRESTWGIPGLYLHDWPDRYIHTNFDTAAMIDPTKLKRSAFIAATNAWFLANMSAADVPAVLELLKRNALKRSGDLSEYLLSLEDVDKVAASRIHFEVERAKVESIGDFAAIRDDDRNSAIAFIDSVETLIEVPTFLDSIYTDERVFERNTGIKGPMSAFGYSYVVDKYSAEAYAELELPKFTGSRGSAGQYVYEALNLVNGQRTVSEIRDWLMTELGPVPLDYVADYLDALASIDVVRVLD